MFYLKTEFIYDPKGKAIGKIDEDGNVLTLSSQLSQPYVHTPRGVQVSGAHVKRVRAARKLLEERDTEARG